MSKTRRTILFLTQSAVIAAIYAVLTLAFQPISYGAVQVRISEGLCILPLFTNAAVPGLYIGCVIANLIGGNIPDAIFGALATLGAAALTWLIGKLIKKNRKIVIAPFPAVIINALVVPFVIYFGYYEHVFTWNDQVVATEAFPVLGLYALSVFIGQLIACYGIGTPLYFALKAIDDRTHFLSLPKKGKEKKPEEAPKEQTNERNEA